MNLAGLFWLQQGDNTFGSNATNDIVFPPLAAPSVGTFRLRDDKVLMSINPDVEVTHLAKPVEKMWLLDDTTLTPTVVKHGSFSWNVIKRDNQFAIRLRDFDHPLLHSFESIDHYPTAVDLRVAAGFYRYDEPRVIQVGTVIEGLSYNPWSPGVVRFELDGEWFELEAYDAAGELFFVFGDRTSGRETYPAGRFLYAEAPDSDGKVLLDFNTAQNPPCAFNQFATCPVASPRNRLAIKIEAGERFNPADH